MMTNSPLGNHPITTIIGLLVALCPVIGSLFPEVKATCDTVMQELIGLGFISAADGMRRSRTVQELQPIGEPAKKQQEGLT